MLFGHGGDVYSIARKLGIRPYEVLDFSSNCSPLPYPEELHNYLCQNIHQMHLLPEVDSLGIRNLLAQRYNLSKENFLIGSGTTQWIFTLPRLLKPKKAFICLPTYADYEDACKASDIEVTFLGPFVKGLNEDSSALITSLDHLKDTDISNSIIFLCNPNNPTGLFIEPDQLLEIILKKPDNLIWIIDEAYAPFVASDNESSLLTRNFPANVIILRSFSKIYGIPGLRVGCLVCKGAIMDKLWQELKPWSVNRMAQLAVEFFLKNIDFEKQVRNYCKQEKEFLVKNISALSKAEYIKGQCHFALFKLKSTSSASDIKEALESEGMLIRDCHNFRGLSGEYIRISPRLHQDNLKLVKTIKYLLI